ncbi:MAG: SMP-30/gluconolactonase/LRE family protein [Gammaproteobacteria bacterium]|nr:SMP-30/gluconolactonase/LRE family protein [Gammaproteobacteria bacterium]
MQTTPDILTDKPNKGLDRIVEPGTSLEKLESGFKFTEGPAWHAVEKYLVFSDIIGNTMYRWSAQDGVSIYRKPSHMANGNTWDREGRLLSCEHATSRVSLTHVDGTYEVLASHYQGRELNSPNDIIVSRNGDIFFTDPASGRTQGYGVEREQELDFQGVFKLDPSSLELTLLADDFILPNGLCFSQDERHLFVNDTRRQHIRVFDVTPDHAISNSHIWASTDGDLPGVADGMKLDSAGNLYSSGSGGIHVFDPQGERLGVILTPEVAANFTWGGENLDELFITATSSIYRLRVKIPGFQPLTP